MEHEFNPQPERTPQRKIVRKDSSGFYTEEVGSRKKEVDAAPNNPIERKENIDPSIRKELEEKDRLTAEERLQTEGARVLKFPDGSLQSGRPMGIHTVRGRHASRQNLRRMEGGR